MATRKKSTTTKSSKAKTVDLPPKGDRNEDPLTGAPGSHPIETGLGTALGGAATGLAAGAIGGPVGAVIGAVVGGVAGAVGGHYVGEAIDPTTEDEWFRDYYDRNHGEKGKDSQESYRSAYHYGTTAYGQYRQPFDKVENDLRSNWEKDNTSSGMTWDRARDAVRDAYDRSVTLHEERLKVNKDRETTGGVKVRKEVRTEHKQVTVPVEREEVVIERRPASGHATADIRAEEIRIPVSEEKVHVSKETVAKEEVRVGKRKVQETKTVEADVRHEELAVETEGNARVHRESDRNA